MRAVFALLVTLLGVSHGVEAFCDGRRDGAQCYGALGGSVDVQLMDSASETYRYQWRKGPLVILHGRKNRIVSNLIESRFSFTPNDGTFRINDLSRNDGGEYTLEIYDDSGAKSMTRTLQLTIQGVETFCDGRQDGAQCYGALGGSVDVRLMDSASETFKYQWKKGSTTILHGRKNRIVSNLIESRSSFAPNNGTFTINDLSRNDGGEYTLEIFDDSGEKPLTRTLQLTIQAPVSSVQLVSECLSQGEKRVSCSSERGDSPQYSWTLDGNTLTDTQLLSGSKESQIITLKVEVSGRLVCSVRNHISRDIKEEEISTCGFEFFDCELLNGTHIKQWLHPTDETQCNKPTTIPTEETDKTVPSKPSTNITTSNRIEISTDETRCIKPGTHTSVDHSLLVLGLRAAVVTLILIGITVYFVWKKKRIKKAERSAAPETMEYENTSVMMVEMRSSAAEL